MTTSAANAASLPSRLVDGYRAFRSGVYLDEKARYEKLADIGQTPQTMIISCCDSRAAPETIFNASPGELFVVRNVANLVPPYEPDGAYHSTSAALEFAVQALKVNTVLVMGHARCGGVQAALTPDLAPLSEGDFIGKWIDLLSAPAEAVTADAEISEGERQTALERTSVRYSIANLRTFPYVAKLEEAGELTLAGAWFDISSGELWGLDPESGRFSMVSAHNA
ncbi:MAG: carbonic anhydrase [Pseudomonadota bacterium]